MKKTDRIFLVVLASLAIWVMTVYLTDKVYMGLLMFLVVFGLSEAIDKED